MLRSGNSPPWLSFLSLSPASAETFAFSAFLGFDASLGADTSAGFSTVRPVMSPMEELPAGGRARGLLARCLFGGCCKVKTRGWGRQWMTMPFVESRIRANGFGHHWRMWRGGWRLEGGCHACGGSGCGWSSGSIPKRGRRMEEARPVATRKMGYLRIGGSSRMGAAASMRGWKLLGGGCWAAWGGGAASPDRRAATGARRGSAASASGDEMSASDATPFGLASAFSLHQRWPGMLE